VEGPEAAAGPQGLFGKFLRLLAILGGWVVVALMAYTVLDVVMRYCFNNPFSSSLEVTEFAMSAIVFLGIAYCGWLGGHVAVDIFERTFVGALLFIAIAWLTMDEAIATMHRVSNMLRWPHYPFQFVVAFGSAMYAIVLFIQCFWMIRTTFGARNVAR
jgi:TRAP-type C4-dicarboxylate transport system permease small subunit